MPRGVFHGRELKSAILTAVLGQSGSHFRNFFLIRGQQDAFCNDSDQTYRDFHNTKCKEKCLASVEVSGSLWQQTPCCPAEEEE
jgi:hypothetical protein